ncbi:MAG: Diguanylate cyclase [Desulfotomaculum sp. 46_296]|nr:MAG: Diguanylate cyclase [Desulfotomaculum sp. 46_296]
MINISEIMENNPVTISPYVSVKWACEIMEKHRFGGLPVVNDGLIVGILTSRDVRRCHPNRLVADAMIKNVLTLSPETSLWEAREFIETNCIEHLLIANESKLLGIITKSLLNLEFGKQVDTLTGLYRSDYLYYMAARLLKEGIEIAVLFIDLDDFGVIDKERGHVTGDIILKQVAEAFKEVVDDNKDYLCRYAGDEFAIVTSSCLKDVRKLGVILLDLLTKQQWPNGINLNASIGIAGGRRGQLRPGDERRTVSELINLASLGSARAKKNNARIVFVGQVEVIEDEI